MRRCDGVDASITRRQRLPERAGGIIIPPSSREEPYTPRGTARVVYDATRRASFPTGADASVLQRGAHESPAARRREPPLQPRQAIEGARKERGNLTRSDAGRIAHSYRRERLASSIAVAIARRLLIQWEGRARTERGGGARGHGRTDDRRGSAGGGGGGRNSRRPQRRGASRHHFRAS